MKLMTKHASTMWNIAKGLLEKRAVVNFVKPAPLTVFLPFVNFCISYASNKKIFVL